jgi:hypothetical protein
MVKGTPTIGHTALRHAIQAQQAIGWGYAFRGYLTLHWTQAQQVAHPRATLLGIRRQWLKYVIREIWGMQLVMWEERNRILHSATQTTVEIRLSAIDAKIKRIYSLQDTFARSDWVLFDTPLVDQLTKTQRFKKTWLSLVARYHPTTTQRQSGKQPTITKFFLRKEPKSEKDKRLDPNTLQDPPNIQVAQKLQDPPNIQAQKGNTGMHLATT